MREGYLKIDGHKDYQMAFPNGRMAVIPNASHLHQIEQPELFKAVVRNFLKG